MSPAQGRTDLVHAQSVPRRHGRNYVDLMVEGWVAVAGPRLDRGATVRVERIVAP